MDLLSILQQKKYVEKKGLTQYNVMFDQTIINLFFSIDKVVGKARQSYRIISYSIHLKMILGLVKTLFQRVLLKIKF